MRIIRFIAEDGRVLHGERIGDSAAAVLDWPRPDRTGEQARIARLHPPVDPPNILCIGRNYAATASQRGSLAADPLEVFMKPTTALIADGEPIRPSWPDASVTMDVAQLDYEGELAIVIGREARRVDETEALRHILGYTIANDVTARFWQAASAAGPPRWMRGKGFDTFCPLGPVLVTADELPEPDNLELRTFLNGEMVQHASTAQMARPVSRLVSELSMGLTLRAGTLILTGTPPGTGSARTPPRFLRPGDEIVVEIAGLGRLRNIVAAAEGCAAGPSDPGGKTGPPVQKGL